jgi:hypothetical protein
MPLLKVMSVLVGFNIYRDAHASTAAFSKESLVAGYFECVVSCSSRVVVRGCARWAMRTFEYFMKQMERMTH